MSAMLSDRTDRILTSAVEEYIRTGEPVSSASLYERYDFGIRPAMIRRELQSLVERGYLNQPSHSAGRVPSDKGYEFYAEVALREVARPRQVNETLRMLFAARAWEELLIQLSDTLGLLGAVSAPVGEVYKEGLSCLIERLDWETKEELEAIIRDFESLDERLRAAHDIFDEEHPLEVFIGTKSPITRSARLAVISGTYQTDRDRVSLFAIGPKRMDYRKVVRIFRGIHQ